MEDCITMKERLGHKKRIVDGKCVEQMSVEACDLLANMLLRNEHGRRICEFELQPAVVERLQRHNITVKLSPGPGQRTWSVVTW